MNNSEHGPFEIGVLVLLKLSRGANSRRKILLLLLSGPKNCNQLAKETELDWWTVKKHLLSVMKENLVKSSDFGNSKFYKLTPNGEVAIRSLLSNSKEWSDIDSQEINNEPKS